MSTSNPTLAQEVGVQTYPGLGATEDSSESYPGPARLETVTSESQVIPPDSAPQPQPGKASVSGLLYSYTSRIIIPDTHTYFTPALGENKEVPPAFTGPRTDLGDIEFRSDAGARIELDNVTPGSYYLIVWAPLSWIPVINPKVDEVKPVLFTFEADQQYILGVLELAWP